jgi:hypothetical protein
MRSRLPCRLGSESVWPLAVSVFATPSVLVGNANGVPERTTGPVAGSVSAA